MPRPDRRQDGWREVIAPGALDIPDEVRVTLNWGPEIGTARLKAGAGGVIAEIRFDGPAGRQGADAILGGHVGEMSFNVPAAEPAR